MKYIRNFDNLNSAKAATLYSPTLVEMKEGNETYLLNKNLGTKDTKLKVQVNSETGAPEIKKAYTITLNASGGGTVAENGSYVEGTSVTITATANTGYTFSKWSDDNTNASRTITVNNDITLTATFEEAASGETWYFNESVTISAYGTDTYDVSFTSNGKTYSRIYGWQGQSQELPGQNHLLYDSTQVYFYILGPGPISDIWVNEAYRTITLSEPATGNLYNFLFNNATKQS